MIYVTSAVVECVRWLAARNNGLLFAASTQKRTAEQRSLQTPRRIGIRSPGERVLANQSVRTAFLKFVDSGLRGSG